MTLSQGYACFAILGVQLVKVLLNQSVNSVQFKIICTVQCVILAVLKNILL